MTIIKRANLSLFLLSTIACTEGFVPSVRSSVRVAKSGSSQFPLMAMTESEIEALKEKAAKAREEANKLAVAMGREPMKEKAAAGTATITEEQEVEPKTTQEVLDLISSLSLVQGDALKQTEALDSLVESGELSKWKNALRQTTNINGPLRPYAVTLNFLDRKSGGKLTAESLGFGGLADSSTEDVSLDDFKYATLGVTLGCTLLGIGSLAFLPENVGAAMCYFFAIIPVLFLGIGSSAPGLIAAALKALSGKGDSEEDNIERICQHEAGHFLCGYLCGLPVKDYSTNTKTGVPLVEFHAASTDDGVREFTMDEIAALSVVALSGSVAEVLALGSAKGGENDLLQLQSIFRRSKEFIGAQKQQDLTRWGAMSAYELIQKNLDSVNQLAEAFKEKKTVEECIAIIESS